MGESELNLTAQTSSHGGNELSTDTGQTVDNLIKCEIVNKDQNYSNNVQDQESVKSYQCDKQFQAIDLKVDIRLDTGYSNNNNNDCTKNDEKENVKCLVDIKSRPKISLKQLDNKKYSEELTLV